MGVIALNSGNLKTECVRVSYNYQTTSQTFPKHIHHHTYVKTAIYLLVLLNETISLLLCNPVEIPINLGDKQPEIFGVFFFFGFGCFLQTNHMKNPGTRVALRCLPHYVNADLGMICSRLNKGTHLYQLSLFKKTEPNVLSLVKHSNI